MCKPKSTNNKNVIVNIKKNHIYQKIMADTHKVSHRYHNEDFYPKKFTMKRKKTSENVGHNSKCPT